MAREKNPVVRERKEESLVRGDVLWTLAREGQIGNNALKPEYAQQMARTLRMGTVLVQVWTMEQNSLSCRTIK
ncbi:hypothetical protein TNIN_181121 [Trichonephila inaurata madagascariensis]|uniref:Uncharacterized protein n=1 Tax=Trichonephila inaurata madagascariensis TaxID=2747483 RepID=A0A8X6XWZ1_9ARAC|nr:hypothetical protein TNIN_181121 [Trichonephila inaurata madagascariensis]